jgi:hypothetical protein
MEQLLIWMNWTNAFVDYFLSSLRYQPGSVCASVAQPYNAGITHTIVVNLAPQVRLRTFGFGEGFPR